MNIIFSLKGKVVLNNLKISRYDLKELEQINNNKLTISGKIEKIYSEISIKDENNKKSTERIKSLKDKIQSLPGIAKFDEGFLKTLKEKKVELQAKIDNNIRELKELEVKVLTSYNPDFIKGIQNKIIDLEKNKIEKEKELKNIKYENLHYEVLSELFSNKNTSIKKYIIDNMLLTFNEKINFYLPFFFEEELEVSFDKDLNSIILVDKEEVSFETFSSGEKTRLELAVAFSLFMLVKTFFSQTINLLVFDEILDQNLDKFGVKAVIELIDGMKKENSILVISHRDEYKDYFQNKIYVKKVDGFSKINGN